MSRTFQKAIIYEKVLSTALPKAIISEYGILNLQKVFARRRRKIRRGMKGREKRPEKKRKTRLIMKRRGKEEPHRRILPRVKLDLVLN